MKREIRRGGLAAIAVCGLVGVPVALAQSTGTSANGSAASPSSGAQSSTSSAAEPSTTATSSSGGAANAGGANAGIGANAGGANAGGANAGVGANVGGVGANVGGGAGGAANAGGVQRGTQGPQGAGLNTFMTGTLQGTVMNVDLNRSTVTIQTAGGPLAQTRRGNMGANAATGTSGSAGGQGGAAQQRTGALGMNGPGGGGANSVTLQARPFDIANLNPGDVVSLSYNDYNGVLWLQPAQGNLPLQSWAQVGTITGPLQNVNRATGMIEVRGQEFRAHPQQTQGLFPGQFVSLSFAEVGQQPWVSEIQPGTVLTNGGNTANATGTGSSATRRVP